ncbi:MAG: hypothetical protein PUC62_02435 [Oscillospiraceae bacterium]|nr:hypothetical protein [Oscillospiraceae bacterium]
MDKYSNFQTGERGKTSFALFCDAVFLPLTRQGGKQGAPDRLFCYAKAWQKNKMRHFLAPSGQPKMMRKNFVRSGFCP